MLFSFDALAFAHIANDPRAALLPVASPATAPLPIEILFTDAFAVGAVLLPALKPIDTALSPFDAEDIPIDTLLAP